MDVPTTEQLKQYAERLPPLYKEILEAYPLADPGRRAGYPIAFPSLAAHFANRGIRHDPEEIGAACERLAARGFCTIRNYIFAHPTELGEKLIEAVTGTRAPRPEVPDLPEFTW